MSLPRGPGGGSIGGRQLRAAGGLRAAWERQQQAAELAALAGRAPQLGRSKPAFFAAQLQPVLLALRQAGGQKLPQNKDEEEEDESDGSQQGEQPQPGERPVLLLEEAAAHLRRLVALDRQAGANACLLLWLLLHMALDGEREWAGRWGNGWVMWSCLSASHAALVACAWCMCTHCFDPSSCPAFPAAGGALVQLVFAMGWQHLLLEALPLLAQQQRQRWGCWQEAQAALVAAVAAGSGGADLAQQLLQRLADRVHRQLTRYQASTSGVGGDSGECGSSALRQALLADMQSLQQLLLECPAAAIPTPAAAAALHQLQGAADACMGALMQAVQQPRADEQEQQRQERQAVFQQLCQLRARLMLSFAAAATASTDSGDSEASAPQPVVAPLLLVEVDSSSCGSSATTAAQVWRTVLQMPADVPAAAAAAAAAASAAGEGGMPLSSRQQFLAACVAVECYQQAATGVNNSNCSATAAEPTGYSFGFRPEIAALPGVRFELPPVPQGDLGPHPAAAKPTGVSAAMAAAAEAAAAEVAQDPGCLGPAQLALTAFQLAEQLAVVGSAIELAGAAGAGTSAWQLLLELGSAAAASATEPAQQRQLLLLLLHGQRAWQQRLRRALAADQQLQQRCRRELVAVANRLASGDQSCLPLFLPACMHVPTCAALVLLLLLLSCF